MPIPLPYLDFALRLSPDGQGGLNALVQHAPVGGGSSSARVPLGGAELEELLARIETWARGETEARPVATPQDRRPEDQVVPGDLGRRLFEDLFRGRVRDSYLRSRERAVAAGHRGLRLRLVFDLEEGIEATRLAALPWELLYEADARSHLARNRETPVVRALVLQQARTLLPFDPPLKVLLASANPPGTPPLRLERERDQLLALLRRERGVEVEVLKAAQAGELRETLKAGGFHVLHVMAHGGFDSTTGQGALVLTRPSGASQVVPGPILADTLRGLPCLRLVCLNACETAHLPRREALDPYTGVAAALVLAEIPAVIAMQFAISNRAAMAFSTAFYRALSAGDPIEAAMAEGRLAVLHQDSRSREWATPALFLPLVGEPVLGGFRSTLQVPKEILGEIRDDSGYIEQKTRGFVGRRFVLDALEEFSARSSQGYFLLLGDPGIGKTSLVAELVRSRRCLHHFNQRAEGVVQPEAFLRNVCAQLILEHGLDFASLPPRAGRDSGFLSELLRQVSGRLGSGERVLLAVDALDESDTDSLPSGVNALYLPSLLPPGVFLLVSSRNTAELPRLDGPEHHLSLLPSSADNLADIRELIGNHLGLQGVQDYVQARGLSESGFIDALAAKSEGNFMYLHHVLPAIGRGEYRTATLEAIPSGLTAYYEQHWRRMRLQNAQEWRDVGLPVLALLTVANFPLPAELLARYLRLQRLASVREVLTQWRPFLHCTVKPGEGGRPQKLYSLYHTSFFKFIQDKDEVLDEGLSLKAVRERLLLELVEDDIAELDDRRGDDPPSTE